MEQFLQTRSRRNGNGEEAIFVDPYFAEAFAWNTYENPTQTRIYSLNDAELCCNDEKITHIVVFDSCLSKDSAYLLRRLLKKLSCQHCAIFTSVSPEAASGINYSISRRKKQDPNLVDDREYASLKELLEMPNITINYFPLHTLHILLEVTYIAAIQSLHTAHIMFILYRVNVECSWEC